MENEYRVLYIDEDPQENNRFERKFVNDFIVSTVDFEGITLDSLSADLEERNFDYLIVDFHLNEKSGCGFDGDEVLQNFLAKFPDFPAMLLTNHGEVAVEQVKDLDVEKIRSKKEYLTDEFRQVFTLRVKAKIDDYKSKNSEAQERIQELLTKKATAGQELTAEEEDELIRLDTFVDESLAGDARKIPEEMKSMTNTNRLETLLNKTDQLIEKLKKYETIQEN